MYNEILIVKSNSNTHLEGLKGTRGQTHPLPRSLPTFLPVAPENVENEAFYSIHIK
jgi:hypothetical protein